MRSHFLPRPAWTMTLHRGSICASPCSWDNRCMPPCLAFYWLRWALMNIFPQAGLEPKSS
jgi:hypothetical protein